MHKKKRQKLGAFEKAIGTLVGIAQVDGFLIAKISRFEIVLPSEQEEKLFSFVGKQIAILRTDIPGKEYLYRIIPEMNESAPMTTQSLCIDEQMQNYSEVI